MTDRELGRHPIPLDPRERGLVLGWVTVVQGRLFPRPGRALGVPPTCQHAPSSMGTDEGRFSSRAPIFKVGSPTSWTIPRA